MSFIIPEKDVLLYHVPENILTFQTKPRLVIKWRWHNKNMNVKPYCAYFSKALFSRQPFN